MTSKMRTCSRLRRTRVSSQDKSKATSIRSASSRSASRSWKNQALHIRASSPTRSLCRASKSKLARMKYRNLRMTYNWLNRITRRSRNKSLILKLRRWLSRRICSINKIIWSKRRSS